MQPPVFDRAQVDHLAALAALSLAEDEADSIARELRAIVAYVEELSLVDTSTVSELGAPAPASWREDAVTAGLSREDALGGAPRATEGGFSVPGFVPAGMSGTR